MILVLCGKTCSGKDTIKKKLCKDFEFESIVTCTTRPPRKNEVDGVDYNFMTEEEFRQTDMLEVTHYNVADGSTWYYGSMFKDFLQKDNNDVRPNKVIIMNPDGLSVLNEYNGIRENCFIVYVFADKDTIYQRLEKRGDNRDEANRRVAADDADFKNINNLIDCKVNNIGDIGDAVWSILDNFQRKVEEVTGGYE